MSRRLVLSAALALVAAACSSKKDSSPAPCTTPPVLGALASTAIHPDASTGPQAYAGDRVTIAPASVTAACGSSHLLWHWDLLARPVASGAALATAPDGSGVLVTDLPSAAWDVMAAVTDDAGNTSEPVFARISTSACGALAPAVSVADATVHANAPVALSATVTDPNAACPAWIPAVAGYRYAWRLVEAPAGADVSLSETASATPTLLAGTPGSYGVEVTVTSSTGIASEPATAAVTVDACGSAAPVVTAVLSPASRPAVGTSVTLAAFASDADNGGTCALSQGLAFEWALVSAPVGSTTVVAGNVSSTTIPGDRLTFVPDLAGTFAFDVVAVDSTGLRSAPHRIELATGPCGPTLPPIQVAGTPGTPGSPVTFSFSGVITDVCVAGSPSPTVRWALVAAPAGSGAVVDALTGVLVPDLAGLYTVRAMVTDVVGYASTAETTVAVGACVLAPTISGVALTVGGSPVTSPYVGDQVELHASAAPGPCGLPTPLRFQWALLGRPAGSQAVLPATDGSTAALLADVANGRYDVAVTATDGFGNVSAPSYVTFQTSACGANLPIVSITPPNPATTFELVALNATATDADSACPARFDPGALTVHWALAGAPAGASATLASAEANTNFLVPDVAGNWIVEAWATTAAGLVGPRSRVTLPVASCDSGPSIGAIQAFQQVPDVRTSTGTTVLALASPGGPPFYPAYPVVLGASVATGALTCPLSVNLAYEWRIANAPALSAARLDDATRVNPAFVPDLPGVYLVELTVTDGLGFKATTSTALLVGTCGLAPPVPVVGILQPIATPPPVVAASFPVGSAVQLDGSASSDPDAQPADLGGCGLSPPMAWRWRFLSAPWQAQPFFYDTGSVAPSELIAPTVLLPDAGLYTVELTVSDGLHEAVRTVDLTAF